MGERRGAIRQKSFLRGRIIFNHNRTAVDCLVRDISDTGARLIFSSAVPVPDVFDLYIPQKELTLRSQAQWRHGEEIGVAFAQIAPVPDEMSTEPADINDRVQKLELEVAQLKRMIRRLQAAAPSAGNDAA